MEKVFLSYDYVCNYLKDSKEGTMLRNKVIISGLLIILLLLTPSLFSMLHAVDSTE